MASDDGRGSFEDELRRMALAGASDEELQEFINARRCGNVEHANRMLVQFQTPAPPSPALTPLERLRVAALRPVVNRLDAQALYAYICILWPITEQALGTTVEPTCWASDTFVDSIADSLMRVVLQHVHSGGAGPDGPSPLH